MNSMDCLLDDKKIKIDMTPIEARDTDLIIKELDLDIKYIAEMKGKCKVWYVGIIGNVCSTEFTISPNKKK